MQCRHCKTEIPDEAKFCLNCGAAQGKSWRNNGTLTLLILLAAVFVAVMAYLIVRLDVERRERSEQNKAQMNSPSNPAATPSSNDKSASTPPQPEPVAPPKPTSREQQLVKGSLTVEPRLFKWFEFKVPERATIHGRFIVSGGSFHDVRVIVTDQQGFMNLQSRKSFTHWFDSGPIKVGSINTDLPPGEYVLVFSNLHSIFADAQVSANISLTQFSSVSR